MLQFGGWGGLTLTSFLVMVMVMPFLPAFLTNLAAVFFGVLVSHIYRYYIRKNDWKGLKVPKLVPRVLLASIIQGAVLAALTMVSIIGAFLIISTSDTQAIDAMMGMPEVEGVDDEVMQKFRDASIANFSGSKLIVFLLSFVASYVIYFICWSALYFAYQFLQKAREVDIERWKLSASVKDAELSALKSQINPHFIFNSLNNIRSLVIEDSERARDSITHLSDLLRFSIQFDQYEKISLEKELEVVKDYLNLEAIQLEERLQYKFFIDERAKEILVPPMIVQTLVENAIKHSINELPNGGDIIIGSRITPDFLNLYVKNTGQLKAYDHQKKKERRGIGITNSRERLRLLYGEKASLTVENMNENMVCATVKIPLN